MRRIIVPIGLAAALFLAVTAAPADDLGKQFSCSASSEVAVEPLIPGPSCVLELSCLDICFYAVRVSVTGTGLVSAEMSATMNFGEEDDSVSWVEPGNPLSQKQPPACSGTFECSAPADDEGTILLLTANGDQMGVTIRCSSGGVAVGMSLNCQVNNLEGDN